MTTTHDTTGKKTYRVYADYTTRCYQEIEASSPQEAYEIAASPPGCWQNCFEHEESDQYRLSDDVQDVETGEFITVGNPARCTSCGSDIVEGINGSNFRAGECGACEDARYRSASALHDAARWLADELCTAWDEPPAKALPAEIRALLSPPEHEHAA